MQAVLQWIARQSSSRSQGSAEAPGSDDGGSSERRPPLELPMTQKQFVMSHPCANPLFPFSPNPESELQFIIQLKCHIVLRPCNACQ